ncbi:thiamine-phosphate kinase [Qipengyuania nanhaisediminis]|uniref:thiamine-phosphate kinase n=1 Tax=Qipengyuania nanhaisediminis TaxID=604088 RepID=UPI000B87F8F4|nr:thiamine-phosphate kinase [Qipengyuania nanhaisediminis]
MKALATSPAARGLEDDAAIIELGDETLVLTHDTMIEGVHTLAGQDPADVAWKLVAVNLSDLAAKGAKPIGVLISHMLGDDDHRFVTGLREVLETYDVPLLGGDTVRGDGERVWGCTAIGRATHCPVPSRSGARPGDAVYLSGRIGYAMLGLEALLDDTDQDDSAYRRPVPQLALGQELAPHASAMMDVSDGLLLDASRIARASGVTLSLDSGPLANLAPEGRLDDAIRWGDDYVLLCTGPAGLDDQFEVTPIGEVGLQGDHEVLLDNQPPQGDLGYTH